MPPQSQSAVRVEGLDGLRRAFRAAGAAESRELTKALRESAEPVRGEAETLAVARVRNVGLPWSRMRVGTTRRSVYVAPRERGVGRGSRRSRPRFAELLLERAMMPALESNIPEVTENVDRMLETVGRIWERTP